MTNITISLNNERATFFPGDIVAGNINILYYASTAVKGIILKCEGIEETDVREGVPADKEIIFAHEVNVLKQYRTGKQTVFDPGSYTFPFSYRLPLGIPNTFHTNLGSIRYFLRSTIKACQGCDTKAELPFCVLEQVDLNTNYIQLQNPTEIHIRKDFTTCFCFKRGHFDIQFTISKAAYAPGESLCFSALISNHTQKAVDKIAVILMQEASYERFRNNNKRYDKKHVYKSIQKIRGPQIPPGENTDWVIGTGEVIIKPTYITFTSELIQVRYAVQIEVKFPDGKNLLGSIPIIIGSKPSNIAEQPYYGPYVRRVKSQAFTNQIRGVCHPGFYCVFAIVLLMIFVLIIAFVIRDSGIKPT